MNVLRERVAQVYYTHGLLCASHPFSILVLVCSVILILCYPLLYVPLPGNIPVEYETPLKNYKVPKDSHQRPEKHEDQTDLLTSIPRWYKGKAAGYVQQVVVKTTVSPWEPTQHDPLDALHAPLKQVFGILDEIEKFRHQHGTMFVCWECEKTFGTNDALKMHLANHGFTRVLCPWCYDQKRMFRRIVDFKMHVKSAHPAISKKDGELSFLKEKNGFFIADSPMNYRRTMGTVPPEDSAAAIFLKSAIEDWCEKFVGRVDRPKEEWHALWRKYGGILSPEHQPELDYGNSYSPTRPDIDAIISLDIGSSGAVAVIYGPVGEGNIAFRRLTISRIAVADQKKRDRLMRRMLCITEKPTFSPPPPEIWEDLDGTTERCLPRMLDALGMDASDLCRVEKRRAATKRKAVQETLESTIDSSTPITKEADRPINHDESQEVIGPGGDQGIEDVLETNFPVNEEEVGQATTKKAATSLQLRAHKLLVNGAMPLFPPARRDWSCGASITLPISGPLACWPPVGWETMSPDAKLLSWETMATILFTSGMGELPDDRGSILDTFQFLALPGTKEGKRLSSIAEHMRFCNFRVVRKIATGDYKGKDATAIIEQFEAACKPMLLPTFVSEISELLRDIPLRMR